MEERQRRENAEAEIAELKKQLAAKEASAKVMPSSASWGHQKNKTTEDCALMAGKKRKEEELGGSTGKKQRKL